MGKILQFFENTNELNLFFVVVAIVSLIFGIYSHFKNRKTKQLVYNARTFRLIDDKATKIEKFDLTYNGNTIKNLSITKLAIWNDGNDTLKFSQMANSDPLRIEIDGENKILDVKLDYSEIKNNIKMKSEKNKTCLISFDYLDPLEGLVLSIYHDTNSMESINIFGSFMGSSEIKQGFFKKKSMEFFHENYTLRLWQKLYDSKLLLFKIIAVLLLVPTTTLLFPFMIPFIIYDTINDRFYRKIPQEFELNE